MAASCWDQLDQLRLPVLVLHGDVQRGSLLPQSAVERYREALPNCRSVLLADSGHDLREPSADLFYQLLSQFLSEVDAPPKGRHSP